MINWPNATALRIPIFDLHITGFNRRLRAMGITRRDFLTRVGQAGGYSAAFLTMQGLGLIEARAARPESIRAEAGSGKGTKVVVLGGGIAGLVASYELRALGY